MMKKKLNSHLNGSRAPPLTRALREPPARLGTGCLGTPSGGGPFAIRGGPEAVLPAEARVPAPPALPAVAAIAAVAAPLPVALALPPPIPLPAVPAVPPPIPLAAVPPPLPAIPAVAPVSALPPSSPSPSIPRPHLGACRCSRREGGRIRLALRDLEVGERDLGGWGLAHHGDLLGCGGLR